MSKLTDIKFMATTDNVDIDAESIGVHTLNSFDNRGLCIQIRHNGNKKLFALANEMARIIERALNSPVSSIAASLQSLAEDFQSQIKSLREDCEGSWDTQDVGNWEASLENLMEVAKELGVQITNEYVVEEEEHD